MMWPAWAPTTFPPNEAVSIPVACLCHEKLVWSAKVLGDSHRGAPDAAHSTRKLNSMCTPAPGEHAFFVRLAGGKDLDVQREASIWNVTFCCES